MKLSPIIGLCALSSLLLFILISGCNGTPPPPPTTTPPATPVAVIDSASTTPTPTPLPSGITITSPVDGTKVDYRTTIKGTSSGVYGTGQNLYIVILPQDPGDTYWVQPDVNLRENGEWSFLAYFGDDASSKFTGKKFTVYAVVSPEKLKVGRTDDLPGTVKQTIDVTRN